MFLTLLVSIKIPLSVYPFGCSCDVRGLRCFGGLGGKLSLHFAMYETLGY